RRIVGSLHAISVWRRFLRIQSSVIGMLKQTASARETTRNSEYHHTTIHTTHPFVEIWRFRKLLKMRSLRWGFGVEPYYPKLCQCCCRLCVCVSKSQCRKLICASCARSATSWKDATH